MLADTINQNLSKMSENQLGWLIVLNLLILLPAIIDAGCVKETRKFKSINGSVSRRLARGNISQILRNANIDPHTIRFGLRRNSTPINGLASNSECGKGNFKYDDESAFRCYDDEQATGERVGQSRQRPFMGRISNGVPMKKGQFPSYVSLYFQFSNHKDPPKWSSCGGTLVGDQIIITAAHCLIDRKWELTAGVAFLGEVELSPGKRPMVLINHCYLKDFRSDPDVWFHNDVAIVILEHRVKYNENIQPACLMTTQRHKDYVDCYVAGMGKINDYDPTTDKLYSLPVRRSCDGIPDRRLESVTCYKASERRGSTCVGDSGGPIYCLDTCGKTKRQSVVAGVSFGSAICQPVKAISYGADYFKLRYKIETLISECIAATNTEAEE